MPSGFTVETVGFLTYRVLPAALLLVSEEIAKRFTDDPIRIIGSGQASDGAMHSRAELTTIPAALFVFGGGRTSRTVGPAAT